MSRDTNSVSWGNALHTTDSATELRWLIRLCDSIITCFLTESSMGTFMADISHVLGGQEKKSETY